MGLPARDASRERRSSPLRGVIFDVDGTLAETEAQGHLPAFNRAFAKAGLAWRWSEDRYAELLEVTGGFERILADMATRADAPVNPDQRRSLARELHQAKNGFYVDDVAQARLPARPGVVRLINECRAAGLSLGIATTTSRVNALALLAALFGPQGTDLFDIIICAEEAPRKKPDPLAYTMALTAMNCPADAAIAIEDSPNGLFAAHAAGLATVVTPSRFFPDGRGGFEMASLIVADLDSPVQIDGQSFATITPAALDAVLVQAGRRRSPG